MSLHPDVVKYLDEFEWPNPFHRPEANEFDLEVHSSDEEYPYSSDDDKNDQPEAPDEISYAPMDWCRTSSSSSLPSLPSSPFSGFSSCFDDDEDDAMVSTFSEIGKTIVF